MLARSCNTAREYSIELTLIVTQGVGPFDGYGYIDHHGTASVLIQFDLPWLNNW